MVRTYEIRRALALVAAVALSSIFLSGCVSNTPRTELTWFPKGDSHARRVASNDDTPTPRPRPAPRHRRHDTAPVRVAAANCPPVQNRPAWYTQNTPRPTPQDATYTDVPPATTDAPGFAWPIAGQVIADFGSTGTGGRNDGINIAAPSGTPIHAAAAGQISYAGNELRGYGNLVLIKHDGGYITAYAHADRLVVNRGDFVAKGQVIGYAGQTGDVNSPQLHFEIRKGVQPVNPRSLLTSRTASAS